MKKVISFLLCICFMFGICPVNVVANEVQTKYLQVSVNDKVQTYECLWDAKEIFCSVEDLGKITNYDWTQMEDGLEFQFYREYENDNGDYGIELQTSVLVEVDDNKKTAEIDAMGESYSVNCYIKDEEVFLPLEKLLYLLHAEWTIDDNVLCVVPMPLTILDFMAMHSIDLAHIESTSEDVLIDTGWLFSDNEWGQAVYSAIAEVFSDFDGKIFMLWWPGEGHVETAECYENAILQLAKEDEEFIGEDVQSDAMEVIVDSIFSINSESTNKIQNIISVPSNIDDLVQSVPDAVSVLEDLSETFPNIEVSQKVKNVSEKIKNGQIDSSFLEIPEMKSKADELGKIGDGLAILQCVWNAYDVANRVEGWNEEYLSQLDVLANYNNSGSINENVVDYVQSSAQRLIDSYNNPTQAVTDEALQSTMGLLLSKTFEESPFGKVFSIMGAVGTCYGTFDVETAETYDVYSELSVVTFSIKIEQLVRELFRYEDILTTTEKLTSESIEEARDQLMLYLRLNLRNKAQLYNLNLRGNENKNWSETEEAKKLYDEIVKVYAMLAELIETKDCDSRIMIGSNLNDIYSTNPVISEEILLDEKINSEDVLKEFLNSGQYKSYITGGNVLSAEYVMYDINKDENLELLIETTSEAPFYYTWLFTLEGNEVILVYESYGYGQFRYSPTYNAVLVSPETKPFSGTGVAPFYQLEGSNFNHKFTIMQDMGENYYCDITGEKSISDEERNKYFADVVQFEWSKISLSQDATSSKKDLSAYLGGDITEIVNMIGNMHDSGATDGSKEYTNGVIIVAQSSTERGVSYISINGESEYSIRGIEYGMAMDDATAIAYADAAQLKDDLPYYKSFLLNDGNTISFHSEDEAFVDSINIFMAE